MNHRTLGQVAILLSPMMALMLTMQHWPPQHVVGDAAGWLFLAGWLCSAVGMRRLRVLGPGAVARGLSMLQITLLVLASVQQLFDATTGRLETWYYFVCDMAWPGSMAMMLITGVAVWRAGVWTDWRRFVPVLCGLTLPLALLTQWLVGELAAGIVFGGYSCVLWALLGLAVRTGAPQPALAYAKA
ncbi:hypothetical protein LJ737_24620 [Hymenobacter sp. 15J16-1T3B]|uniref:hypothetical protein n=1 Tax=Hymenobacter sp. 15J16-1T3B TaxID=2886941 RepID=UPI001D10790E|nr:hypothetical protein [Hymenobacter sp. 15J16-1T3B]MCC3160444.1 hypothetical protein [Hymenobacter sp. 15J16-1T3B]